MELGEGRCRRRREAEEAACGSEEAASSRGGARTRVGEDAGLRRAARGRRRMSVARFLRGGERARGAPAEPLVAEGGLGVMRMGDPVCPSSPDRTLVPPPPLSLLDLDSRDMLFRRGEPPKTSAPAPAVGLPPDDDEGAKGPHIPTGRQVPRPRSNPFAAEDEALDFVIEEELVVETLEEAKVYVWNLPYDVSSEHLAQLFDQAGVVEVTEASVIEVTVLSSSSS